jgi:hypothetical protein
MDLKENRVEACELDLSGAGWRAFVNTVMDIEVPLKARNFLSS